MSAVNPVNTVIPVNTVQSPTRPPQAAGKNPGAVPEFLPASHVHISSHLQVRIHLQRRLGRTQLEDIASNPQHSDEKYGCSDARCRPIICSTERYRSHGRRE